MQQTPATISEFPKLTPFRPSLMYMLPAKCKFQQCSQVLVNLDSLGQQSIVRQCTQTCVRRKNEDCCLRVFCLELIRSLSALAFHTAEWLRTLRPYLNICCVNRLLLQWLTSPRRLIVTALMPASFWRAGASDTPVHPQWQCNCMEQKKNKNERMCLVVWVMKALLSK